MTFVFNMCWSVRANPFKIYSQASQKCAKLWPQFFDTIMKVIQQYPNDVLVIGIRNYFVYFSGWV